MKVINNNNLRDGRYYIMYLRRKFGSRMNSKLLLLRCIHDRKYLEYIHHGELVRDGFDISTHIHRSTIGDLRKDGIVYELSKDEFNYHILVDNL